MSTLVSEKQFTTPATVETKDPGPKAGPLTRLLASLSRLNGEYTHYQMEEGVWRKLAL